MDSRIQYNSLHTIYNISTKIYHMLKKKIDNYLCEIQFFFCQTMFLKTFLRYIYFFFHITIKQYFFAFMNISCYRKCISISVTIMKGERDDPASSGKNLAVYVDHTKNNRTVCSY